MDIPTFLSQSRSKNAQDRYKSGFNKWFNWSEKFAEISSLPAKPIHVALFLTKLIRSNDSLCVIESAFYAIKHFHKIASLDDPTSSDLCKNRLEAAKRTTTKVTKEKESISSLHLGLIYDHIGGASANLLQLRNFVNFLLSFAGFFSGTIRNSETLCQFEKEIKNLVRRKLFLQITLHFHSKLGLFMMIAFRYPS